MNNFELSELERLLESPGFWTTSNAHLYRYASDFEKRLRALEKAAVASATNNLGEKAP